MRKKPFSTASFSHVNRSHVSRHQGSQRTKLPVSPDLVPIGPKIDEMLEKRKRLLQELRTAAKSRGSREQIRREFAQLGAKIDKYAAYFPDVEMKCKKQDDQFAELHAGDVSRQ